MSPLAAKRCRNLPGLIQFYIKNIGEVVNATKFQRNQSSRSTSTVCVIGSFHGYWHSSVMTSVLTSVSNWLGGGARDPSPERVPITVTADGNIVEQPPSAPSIVRETSGVTLEDDNEKDRSADEEPRERSSLEVDLQEVSEKAINAAKEWGSYLYSFGKAATDHVTRTAKHIRETVEEKTMLGDFIRDQDECPAGSLDAKGQSSAVAPWVGYSEAEVMRSQILDLSKEKRNFLRSPPEGVTFEFDYESSHPVAQVMLRQDTNLEAMRFELVPKQISEEVFWRNYFYRVSLIKRSTQLTSLNLRQVVHDASSNIASDSATTSTCDRKSTAAAEASNTFQTIDSVHPTRGEHDPLDDNLLDDQTIDDLPEWEKDLRELDEYEVVEAGDGASDDIDIERDLMNQSDTDVK